MSGGGAAVPAAWSAGGSIGKHKQVTDQRQAFRSLLVAAGTPIKVVTERLGHAHPGFTMHTYQHLLPGMSAAAAEQFATLVDAATR